MTTVGTLREIARCPVKSMLGESLPEAEVTPSGVAGDRAWGLLDLDTGKIASAKHPRLWAGLLDLRARYDANGVVVVELPDGRRVRADDPDVHEVLSGVVGRRVRLVGEPPAGAAYDEWWPDVVGMAPQQFLDQTRSAVEDGRDVSTLPVGMAAPGTFQDVAPVTLITTASLRAAARWHPAGDWDPRRFRMSLLLDVERDDLPEQEWVGRTLTIGGVRLQVMAPTPRCVMVTLPQQGLPRDDDGLRALARHNRVELPGVGRFASLGAYATVAQPGRLACGDAVTLD